MKLIYQPGKKNQKIDALSWREQDILLKENKKILKKEFQILKPNYLKNNNKEGIKQIIIIEINSIFITGEIIEYYEKNKNFLQEKESSYKIFNIFPLQFLIASRKKKKKNINLKK